MSTVKAGFSFTENFETLLINKSQSMSDVIDGQTLNLTSLSFSNN